MSKLSHWPDQLSWTAQKNRLVRIIKSLIRLHAINELKVEVFIPATLIEGSQGIHNGRRWLSANWGPSNVILHKASKVVCDTILV